MSFDRFAKQYELFFNWFMAWIRLAFSEFIASMILLFLLPTVGIQINVELWMTWTFRIIGATLIYGVFVTYDVMNPNKSKLKKKNKNSES